MSDFSKRFLEVETLKKILHKNADPAKFVDKCKAKFVNNIFLQKPVFTTVPKLDLRIVLPYLGNVSSITKKILNRCISKRLKFCEVKIIFPSGNVLKIYFRFKIVFLKPYNLTLSNGLSAEAAQLPITLKPTGI